MKYISPQLEKWVGLPMDRRARSHQIKRILHGDLKTIILLVVTGTEEQGIKIGALGTSLRVDPLWGGERLL